MDHLSAASHRNLLPQTASTTTQQKLVCSDAQEQTLRTQGFCQIAGVDEVGRGCLFGPVVAAAVVLPEGVDELARAGLKDSKQLTQTRRERLDEMIRSMALAISIAEIDASTIDRINIRQASRLAMRNAVLGLAVAPDHLLVDAEVIDHPAAQTRLIHGDALSLSIAAASVVAKVYRDRMICAMEATYPGYGLAAHKGYGTAQHKRALAALGPTLLHRFSFAPVKSVAHQLR